jgi:hypothetical protein
MKELQLNKVFKTKNYFKFKALVDDEDFEKCNKINWSISKNGYAESYILGNHCYLHIFIFGKKDGFQIDHKDGNKLNNQKNNFRFVTNQENAFNQKSQLNCSSKYKGVSWFKQTSRWSCKIKKKWNQKTSWIFFKRKRCCFAI